MLFLFSIGWGVVSGWWALAGILLGLAYAWALYRQPVQLSRVYRYLLALVRALLVSLIVILLLAPLIRSVTYQSQKPLILVAQDNSASISSFKSAGFNAQQFVQNLSALQRQLGSDYQVQYFNFDKGLHSGLSSRFSGKQTDIASALQQLNERYINQNTGAIVLATDGLYNTGAEPEPAAQKIKTAVYTIALGDTATRRDLLIGNVSYNKTAYLGNDFILEVLAEGYQSKGETLRLTVAEDGKPVFSQSVAVAANAYRKTIPAKLNAGRKGLHRFTISIAPVNNETTLANNTETIDVEVLDARQKVLLVYNSPHPDVSIIKQAIQHNKNYEVNAVSINDLSTVKPADYNLLILHQLTAGSSPVLQRLMANTLIPVWYMLGAQSDLPAFNQAQKVLQISAGQQNMQEAFALPVTGFSAFALSDSSLNKIKSFPPLLAPFGSYAAGGGTQLLLKQRIGNIATAYPLYLFGKSGSRTVAVLAGEGLWRWQLSEAETYGSHHAVEELLSQSVQYLTADASRQRFRIYPAKTTFDEGEHVILNAELYNEALELVNTAQVSVTVKNTAGKTYSYQMSPGGQDYELDAGMLPPGEYTYTGSTRLGSTPFTAGGRFSVKALNLESRQSKADYALLGRIARQSGGSMIQPSQLEALVKLIKHNENIKTVEYEDKHYTEAIDVKWLLGLIIALLAIEWVVRKREGEV